MRILKNWDGIQVTENSLFQSIEYRAFLEYSQNCASTTSILFQNISIIPERNPMALAHFPFFLLLIPWQKLICFVYRFAYSEHSYEKFCKYVSFYEWNLSGSMFSILIHAVACFST